MLSESGETLFTASLGGRLGWFKEATTDWELYFADIDEKALKVVNAEVGRHVPTCKTCLLVTIVLVSLCGLVVVGSLLISNTLSYDANVFVLVLVPLILMMGIGLAILLACYCHVEERLANI